MDVDQGGAVSRPGYGRRTGRLVGLGLGAALLGISLIGVQPVSAHAPQGFMERRQHLIERARTQIGTPYRYGGSAPGGFDCSGFTRWVFAGHGVELPRTAASQYALGDEGSNKRIRSREALKVGDLVFHSSNDSAVGHVGIYVGDGRFISATSTEGIQIRSLYDPYWWGARWVGGIRLKYTQEPPPRPKDKSYRNPGRAGETEPSEEGQVTLDFIGRDVTFIGVPLGALVA